MTAAVEGWDNNSEQKREAEGDIKRYAALVEIPLDTFKKYACADKSKRRKLGTSVGDEARSPRRAFPAKLVELASTCPDILRWNQSERTLIIEDRTRFSKTTGMKWSSFRRQLFRYGFYKHDWRTGVPGIVFANCDPRVVTIDDLAGLVRAAKPQKMWETTRAQLHRVRENDELRKLQDENDELRDDRAKKEALEAFVCDLEEEILVICQERDKCRAETEELREADRRRETALQDALEWPDLRDKELYLQQKYYRENFAMVVTELSLRQLLSRPSYNPHDPKAFVQN